MYVKQIIEILGRGCVAVCEIGQNERLKIGDKCSVKNPDNTVFQTVLTGVEMMNPSPKIGTIGLLFRFVQGQSIQLGAEIYTSESIIGN